MNEWHMIVVDGNRNATHAFVIGFAVGHGIDPAVPAFVDGELEAATVGERLRALVGKGHSTVLAPGTVATALESHGAAVGLHVTHHALIESVSFGWRAETPSREAAAKIRATFADLGPGVLLVEVDEEEIDPAGQGVELRAQVHEYTFRASGRVVGAPDGVVAMRRRVAGLDFVTVEGLRFDERPIA
ncbi:MAG TPA: hypothetical protein VGR62_16950 [Candidatus Binatia bacterium]|jgi:hypothetical protein|nr:hypothetical protein [Candidatus Binatia bacterium]